VKHGLIKKTPFIIGVQARVCDPLAPLPTEGILMEAGAPLAEGVR
jgi:hypothetical protein